MEPALVFDFSKNHIKAGFSNDKLDTPKARVPIVIGRPLILQYGLIENIHLKPLMIADEIAPVRNYLKISSPIENGIIVNEEDTSILYDYILSKKLGLTHEDLKNRKLLMTCLLEDTKKNKAKQCEIIFEKIGLGYLNFETRAKMALYSYGDNSGVVLDSGFDNTYITPIFENYIMHKSIKKLEIGGKHITDYLIKLLQFNGFSLNPIVNFDNINEIKEKLCFVSCEFGVDEKLDRETSYYYSELKLPDGFKISISGEKFKAPEILFKPYLINNLNPGIDEILFDSINVSETYRLLILI